MLRKRVSREYKDHTWGNFAASAALTSATVAASAGFSSLSETGKPRKSVDLPVAAMFSELIVRNRLKRVGGNPLIFLFIYLSIEQVILMAIRLCK
jgi:hypothetical protein